MNIDMIKGQRKKENNQQTNYNKSEVSNNLLKRSIFLSLVITLCSLQSNGQSSTHVVLISIDGLRPEFYLDESYPSPHLRQLLQNGTGAEYMTSVFPSYTYPSHVAMLTGAMPARSGIYYNARQGSQDWYWFTKDIKVPTLWQLFKVKGLTTAAVQWPVSVSDDITWNIPEIWDSKNPYDRITATRQYATPGLIVCIPANVTTYSGEADQGV